MKLNILGGAYAGKSKAADPQKCLNLFYYKDAFGGEPGLMGMPGLRHVATLDANTDYEVRGAEPKGSYCYFVAGKNFYRMDTSYAVTVIAADKIQSSSNPVTMAQNDTQILICDGVFGYLYDTVAGTFTQLTGDDHGFPGGLDVTVQDNQFFTCAPGTNAFYGSALNKGLSWDLSNDQYVIQAQPTDMVRVFSDGRYLWAFKEEYTEMRFNSGESTAGFKRLPAGKFQTGLLARNSAAAIDNATFWLASDFTVRMARGAQATIISPPQLVGHIEAYGTTSDAIGYTYWEEGLAFYQLTFPTEDETWVYEISTRFWAKRSSYRVSNTNGRHRGNCLARFNNKNIVGDYKNSRIYVLDDETYTDNGYAIEKSRRVAPVYDVDRNRRLFFSNLKVRIQAGVGLNVHPATAGYEPKMHMRYSDDSGHIWSNEIPREMGKMGEYDERPEWGRLGSAYRRTFDFRVTDPVKTVILGATVDAKFSEE